MFIFHSHLTKKGFKRHYDSANQDLVPKKFPKQPIFGVGKLDAQRLVPFCNNIKMG